MGKARTPTMYESRCVNKLLGSCEKWPSFLKNAARIGDIFRKRENILVDELNNFFGIISVNTIELMKFEDY